MGLQRLAALACAATAAAAILFGGAAAAPAPPAPFSGTPRWRQLKQAAEVAWGRARSKLDAASVARANAKYWAAFNESGQRDYAAFWDAAHTAAVGCLHLPDQYPCPGRVRDALVGELEATPRHTSISQLVAMSTLDAPHLLRVARVWAASFDESGGGGSEAPDSDAVAAGDAARAAALRTRLDAGGAIRVGYLSGHWGNHPVGHHIGSLLRLHTRITTAGGPPPFTVHCFSTAANDGSAYYARNRAACDAWTDVPPGLNASAAAARIVAAALDVLVSLDGYDTGHRMDVLSLRPAPYQVSFFGFLGTTGADAYVDAILADEQTIPTPPVVADGAVPAAPAPASSRAGLEMWYSERHILRHPTTFFVTDYQTAHPELLAPEVAADSFEARYFSADNGGDEAGGEGEGETPPFTFCSFSQLFKVTPDTFAAWLAILARTGNATRLVLPDYPPLGRAGLEASYPQLLAPPLAGRVAFQPLLPREAHLPWKRATCGLGLDTPGYNGHTSVSDLLWAGVPVVTLRLPYAPMAGRAGGSLVAAAGGPPSLFLTDSYAGYEDAAVAVWEAYEREHARRWQQRRRADVGAGSIDAAVAADGTVAAAAAAAGDDTGEPQCQGCLARKAAAAAAAAATGPPPVADSALLWRPTPEAPLFDRARWVAGYEVTLAGALGTAG